jgi:ABC-type sugar transport system ATPase subunit
MEEVYELADRIVVLRDGRVVGAGAPLEIDRRRLTNLMVGRELAKIDADLASLENDALSSEGRPRIRKSPSTCLRAHLYPRPAFGD